MSKRNLNHRLLITTIACVCFLVLWLIKAHPSHSATCIQSSIPEESEWQLYQVVSVLLWCATYNSICTYFIVSTDMDWKSMYQYSLWLWVCGVTLLFSGLAQGIIYFHVYPCTLN